MYIHGGETAGYNSKIGYNPTNHVTLVVWTNLAVSLDGQQTANTLMLNVLDQIDEVSTRSPSSAPTAGAGRIGCGCCRRGKVRRRRGKGRDRQLIVVSTEAHGAPPGRGDAPFLCPPAARPVALALPLKLQFY